MTTEPTDEPAAPTDEQTEQTEQTETSATPRVDYNKHSVKMAQRAAQEAAAAIDQMVAQSGLQVQLDVPRVQLTARVQSLAEALVNAGLLDENALLTREYELLTQALGQIKGDIAQQIAQRLMQERERQRRQQEQAELEQGPDAHRKGPQVQAVRTPPLVGPNGRPIVMPH